MAFNVGDIIVTIKAKTEDLQRGLSEVQNMANKTRDFGSKISNSMERATEGSQRFLLGVTAAGAGLTALGVAGVKSAGEFEQSRVAFETMLGSADKARKMMADIAEFAKSTPFELPEVVAGSKQLLAFGFAQEQIIPTMRKLGDIASGVGVPVGQLTNVFGQVRVAGRLMGQDLLQFTNAGVPIIEALATTMKKPQKEIKSLVEQGKIGFPEVEAAINSLTGEGSKFGGMMEKQSKTFSGVVSNIKDGFGQMLRSMVGITKEGDVIEGGFFDKIKKAAERLMPIIQNLPQTISEFWNKSKPFLALFIGMIIGGVLPALKAWAFHQWAVIWPLLPWIAGIGALAAVINLVVNKFSSWSEVLGTFGRIAKAVFGFLSDIFGDLFKEMKRVAELIGELLAPLFAFLGRHMEVVKKIGLLLLGLVLLPIIASFAALIAGLKILTVVLRFVADHFETIKKVVVVALAVAFWPIVAVVAAIIAVVKNWGSIMEWVSGAVRTAIDAIVGAWQYVYSVVTGIMSAIWSFIEPILNFIKNVFIIVFGGIAIVVISAMQAIWNVIQPVLMAIWNVINMVVGWIWDRWVNAFYLFRNIAIEVWNAIYNVTSTVWNAVYGVISSILGAIYNFFAPAFSWLYNAGRNIVSGLANGIRSAAGWVWENIKAVADQIGRFFSGAAGWLWDVGRAIVSGLVNGIRSAINWVNDAAGNVADAVKNKLKSVLGIRSPSKVFFEYGININQGLVKGLEKTSKLVEDALTIPGVNVQQNILAGATPQGTSSIVNKQITTNINGPVNINSKEDADYFLKRLDRNIELEGMGLATNE